MTPQAEAQGSRTTEPNNVKRDFRQEVTDQIIQMLDSGTAPWQKPWEAGAIGLPFNPTTKNAYRGANAIHLMATALQRGFEDPRWLTYKQAAANGWQVPTGEKGTHIEYWDLRSAQPAAERSADSPPDKPVERPPRPVHRVYTVFNAQQIDGIPPYERKQHPDWEVVQGAEQILENSGAKILHDRNDEAFYDRLNDRIHLPPKTAFQKQADYYGTALHEMGHWSGHPDRLNRETLAGAYRFGDTNYAKEELRAELASVFLAAERAIPHDTGRHAAYVSSWIKVLKEDKNEIFRAAREANQAADFLLALEREKSVAKALEAVGTRRDGTEKVVAAGREATDGSHRAQESRKSSPGTPGQDQLFADAKALGVRTLGDNARVYRAQTDSGIYRGEILGATEHHVVQRLGQTSAVAHLKRLLPSIPGAGENVAVRYSNGKVIDVAAFEPKGRSREVAR
jgi:antirestriction protein ArdC